ncbi:MAG: right-handed parallel beta-helix repeat-containing protein [Lewinellaceae bacterium]|nr:right-handed parallel beta-helix repeat-containing protein [Lewinellaceae bacterium]
MIAAIFTLLLSSAGQAQCVLLNDNFDANPVLAAVNTDGAWYPDRYRPAGFAMDNLGGENVLKISIDGINDGALNRPSGQQGTFYNTQGRKINQCGKCVTLLRGEIYIPSDWATKHRRTDMWATTFTIADAALDYPIIGFANVDGVSPTLRYWDGSGLGVWVNVAGLVYDTWITLESSLSGGNIVYKVNNVIVGTVPSASSVYFGNIIMQAYNFNDPALPLVNQSTDSYDAYWDNLYTSGNTGANIVLNTTTLESFCSLQEAINDAGTLAGHTLQLEGNLTEDIISLNKALTIDGNGKILTSTSINYGIEVSVAGATIQDLTVETAGTFGIHSTCGSDNLALTNVTVDNCGGTGIALNGSDNCVLTNITSTNNGGNGVSITNCDNLTINGITTSGNAFGGGFNAGIGLFTSSSTCPPAGINGFTLTGTISIAENVKVYAQKENAADVITGLSGSSIEWAVGTSATDRSYWPDKATAYAVVDALFEAPYNLPNTTVFVEEVATDNLYVDDDPNGDATPPMSIQTAVNFAASGKTVFVEDGIFNERITVTKSLTIDGNGMASTVLYGTGLPAGASGITISSGITNVTIQDLGVTAFTGSSPNSTGGIYAVGGNNNLTLKHLDVSNNPSCSGIYIEGNAGVSDVMIDDVKSHGHGSGARGIVIWNGLKSNITIQNCEVYSNNCCGIELQDGTATGVTLFNNNVHDNADSGISPIGLTGPGANLIDMNTVTNNGRFGIEIKLPNGSGATSGPGSIVVQNNTVTRNTTIIPETRDIAGIAVYRRGYVIGNNNVNIPTGVVVQNNTVSGYTQPSSSDGFGIVIEGTNHTVSGNIVSGNNVGIQQQAGHLPYVENTGTDGDQSNLADLYFGRGNAPFTCGNTISGNTLSSNTVNTRDVGAGVNTLAGVVKNTNTGETFCSIQGANDDSNTLNGHSIEVPAGTYVENVTITKSLNILGPNAAIDPNTGIRVTEAIVKPAVIALEPVTTGAIFRLGTTSHIDVTIKGLTIDGSNPALGAGRTLNGVAVHTGAGIVNSIGSFDVNPGGRDVKMTIQNNIIKNLERYGVLADGVTPAVALAGTDVSHNKIDNLPSGNNFGGGRGRAIAFEENHYGSATYNVISRVNVGWQDDNYYLSSPGAGTVVDNNTISTYHRGIFHNLQYSNATDATISNNSISVETSGDFSASTSNFGVELASIQSAVGATVTNNNSAGNVYGILLWNLPTTADITVSGGTLSNNTYGVYATNYDPQFADGSASHAILSGVTINGATAAGVYVEDNPLHATSATFNLTVNNDCEITGTGQTLTGVLVKGADASATVEDNDASIHGFAIGIDVDGGSATVTNNHIYDNGIGIRFTNAGAGTVNDLNNFDGGGNPDNGVDIQATASAGSVTATPNNSFAGDTYGIENLSATDIDASNCYWEAATGPGPVALGGGTPITTKVIYCPWLNAAPPGGIAVGRVHNTNTGLDFCSIQEAIDDAATINGHIITVDPGTYNEQVLVNKEVTIKQATATKPVIDFTGTPGLASGKLTLFEVTSPNVTIEGLDFEVDVTKVGSAIVASSATLNNLTVKDNDINPYRSGAGTVSYSLRNAISINHGVYRINSVNPTILVQNNTVSYNLGVDVMAGTPDDAGFRSGVATDEGGGTITLNTLQTINHDIIVRFSGNASGASITNNNLNGGGIELADQNAAAGTFTVSNNIFTYGPVNDPAVGLLRIKDNYNSIPHVISSNTFNYDGWAVSLENMNSITLDGNTFTSSSPTAHAVVVNTKAIVSLSNSVVQVPIAATLTNNNFNGTGTALTFQNHDSDNDSYGTFTIGSVGNENSFASTLGSFIHFDDQTGASNGSTFPNYNAIIGAGASAITTMACWDQDIDIQNNKFDVGSGLQLPSAMNFSERTVLEAGLYHKPDASCTGLLIYIYPVHNLTQNTYYLTIQSAINAANANDVIECSEYTYNERVTIDKTLTLQGVNESNCVITGTGLAGTGKGITINTGVTGVTIQYLTVQNFAGSSGNADGGIYAVGGNNNLNVNHVTIQNNVGGSGFYANGPVDNVTLYYVTASGHTVGARGIVIWNGLKENITITNCHVFGNNCCGIELQDGTASGVTMTNNNVHDNGDNGIGIVGLQGPGANLVSTNTLLNNGRFGIEIKNPNGSGANAGAGSVVVDNNMVTRNVAIGDVRDIAGIAVFRRGVLAGNVDVPNGVVVSNNTVTGYTQSSTSEGFGIVVEGTNHTVSANTVSGNDVGIQRQAGHLPYPGDGDQSDLADTYFGRGNSPVTCGVTLTGNILSNTIDTRDVPLSIGTGGYVVNTTSLKTFCSIQAAINDAATLTGHTLEVYPGTYNEQVLVNKEVTIKQATATKPVIDFTGTPGLASGKLTLFEVTSPNVTIEGLDFEVDVTKVGSAIVASSATLNNLTVKDNDINPYRSGAGTVSYSLRNAISINHGVYRINSVNPTILVQNNTVSYNLGVDVMAGTPDDAGFRSGVATDEGGGAITLNTLQTINHDIIVRFSGNASGASITNNNLNGGGIELADQNAAAGTFTVSNNIFTYGPVNDPAVGLLRIKDNYNSIPHVISSNTFNYDGWAVSLENMNSITLDGNTFTSSSPTAHAVVVNTKAIVSLSNSVVQVPIAATLTNNNFNGTGTALTFQNHDSDNDSYGTFTIGSVGNENNFASTLGSFIHFDDQTGASNGSTFPNYNAIIGAGASAITTMACWDQDIDIQNNKFDVGSGLQLPSAMNFSERTVLEAGLYHKPDASCTGLLIYIYPVHNLTQNTYYLTIQSAINAANANDVIECSEYTYNERVTIDKTLTLQGVNESNCVITGTGLAGTGKGITINTGVTGVTIQYLTVQNFAGSSGNADGGIYAVGGNNNLNVNHVTIQNNVGGSGFYANGPVDNVTLDYVTASGHTVGARGIVIWNGLKENITITNCHVFGNNCCGIELQDGTASGVTMTNNNVHDNGDNGIGIVGLQGPGANLVSTNTLLNNGRFGIEIKNPNGSGANAGAGSVVVDNNMVTRNVAIGMFGT